MADHHLTFVRPDAVLCYVRDRQAWFTTAPLSKQWGDDWNDVPYEHNAGTPYEHDGAVVRSVWFDPGSMGEPRDGHTNSPWSVENINRRASPWLSTSLGFSSWNREHVHIWAGATIAEVQAALVAAGGSLLVPLTALAPVGAAA